MNSDELLVSVKRATALPSSQIRLSDADVLALADEEIQTKLLPMLTELRNEYLVLSESTALTAGRTEYPIPYRAIGRTLRDVTIERSGGVDTLPYVQPEDSRQGSTLGFYLRADKLVLTSAQSTGTLRLYYELRPSRLVTLAECARVASFSSTAVVVTSLPAIIVTGATVDCLEARSGHTLLGMDLPVTNVAGTTLSLSVPTTLVVGDYIALAETSPVIMLPQEMHQVLAQAVAVRVLESIGDFEALASHQTRLMEKMTAVRSLLTPRVRGAAHVIINQSSFFNRNSSRSRNL